MGLDIASVTAAVEQGVRVVLMPIDVVALINTALSGTAALMGAFATAYALISSIRSKRTEKAVGAVKAEVSEIKTNVTKIEAQTNSMVEKIEAAARAAGVKDATAIAGAVADALKQGQEEGRAATQEDRTIQSVVDKNKSTVPVADAVVGVTTERMATAMESSAATQKEVAQLTKDKDEREQK